MPQNEKTPCYEAILWDWDGTLVNSWQALKHSFDNMLAIMGKTRADLKEGDKALGRSLRDSFPLWFGEDWEKAQKIYYDCFAEIHLEMFSPFPGAEDMLKKLHQGEIRMSVISNKKGAFLRDEIAHLGWTDYFDQIIGAGDCAADKPDPVHARTALPEGFVGKFCVVGDSYVDVLMARNVSADSILVFPEANLPASFENHQPDHHFLDIQALSRWFDRFSLRLA